MDSEIKVCLSHSHIQRWNTQRIVLVPRKKKESIERDRIVMDKSIQKLKTLSLSSILDENARAHKKDIDLFTNGYLNHNNMLKIYKDENEKLLEALEEFDVVHKANSVSKQTQELETVEKVKEERQFVPEILPNQFLNVTRVDQFKTFKMIDQALVERSWVHLKGAVRPKQDTLQIHLDRIEKELLELDSEDLIERLMVYSRTWEIIIEEFKTYGPLLAKIKKVYDDTIAGYNKEENELGYLRNKVSHLLAKNENRMLLKVERKKVSRLQEEIKALKEEQAKMKKDTFRKLSIYSAYIPEHFVKDKLDDQNDLLKDSISKIRSTIEEGMDPLTCLETQVEGLQAEIAQKSTVIEDFKNSISVNYVSKASKELVDESLLEAKEKLGKVLEINKQQESSLKKLTLDLENLKSVLRDKEIQYENLAKEYAELSEAAAISFDKLLLNKNDES